jgi:hypothetical protein
MIILSEGSTRSIARRAPAIICVGKTTIAISDMMKPDQIRRPDKSTLMHQSVYIRLYQFGLVGTKKRKNTK